MLIRKLLFYLGFIAIFSASMPMKYLPVSLAQSCSILLFIIGGIYYHFKIDKRIIRLILYIIIISIINFRISFSWERIEMFIRFTICLCGNYFFIKSLNGNFIHFTKTYINGCFLFSIIAIVQEIAYWFNIESVYNQSAYIGFEVNISFSGSFLQAPSLTQEPAHFGLLLIPALFLLLSDIYEHTKFYIRPWQKFIIMVGFIFTFSFTAYLTFLLMNTLFMIRNIRRNFFYVFFLMALIGIGLVFVLRSESNITAKLNSMFVESDELQSLNNLSAFAVISNALVAYESANHNPLGTGFFTNELNSSKYIHKYFVINSNSTLLNTKDGGSMYIKILSEYSYLGFGLFFIYLLKIYRCSDNNSYNHSAVFMGLWCLLFSFIRFANYNSPLLMCLFSLLVYFSYKRDGIQSSIDCS